ncbi:MAG TPA: hypothetical protein PLC65_12260 [Bacteroidia bacterium]|nr:hypothetical protein [Bacteroidia bacterium]
MDGLSAVKISDLTELFKQISDLRSELKQLKESEEEIKAYSIEQTAKLLNLHYNSVRKLIIHKKLFAKYLDGVSGKTIVPYWAIREYLKSTKNSNH